VVTVSWRRHSPTPSVDLAGSSGGAATLASATAWPCCREIFARVRHVQSKYSVLLLHGCARSPISRIRTYQVDSDVTGSLGLTAITDSANGSPWAGLGPPGASLGLALGKPACPKPGGKPVEPAGSGLHGSTPRHDTSVGRVGPVGPRNAGSNRSIGPSESNQAWWPANLLVKAAGPGECSRPGGLTLQ
jgi:hypothetical protein